MRNALVSLLLLIAVPSQAVEPTPFRWPSHEAIPARISDGAVIANISLDAWQSLYKTDLRTRRDYLCRLVLTTGLSELSKAVIHRTRPNGADMQSFWSEHTAIASMAARSPLSASLAVTVGWGRLASGAHYQTDVGVGATIGLIARRVCR